MPEASRTILGTIAWVYNKLLAAMVAVGAAMIVFMMLSIGGSVIFRRTGAHFAWALEASEYILIVSTLLGTGWLFRTGGHIRVDILTTYLHGRARELYNGFIFSVVALVCLAFTIIGIQSAIDAYLSGVIEEKVYITFPKWVLLCLYPLGGIFMLVESTKSAIDHFQKGWGLKKSDRKSLVRKMAAGTETSEMEASKSQSRN